MPEPEITPEHREEAHGLIWHPVEDGDSFKVRRVDCVARVAAALAERDARIKELRRRVDARTEELKAVEELRERELEEEPNG